MKMSGGRKAISEPIDHNSIPNFSKKIRTFLKLKNIKGFTGHALGRIAATLLAKSSADVLQLKRLGGWKSSTVVESYVDCSVENKIKTATMMSTLPMSSDNSSSSSQNSVVIQQQIILSTKETTTGGASAGLNISIKA
ncbi:hypothetical protein NQ314_014754 [Rhamnusium bicolor]|uniref:Tyr recombinase domain-containing protein n=1 Tax=Rhamnusium bicolor TaxID=1586634 RepID=A0AAV8X031_9CUCU|nr:hypothetical protein NQ314_014754 [Rhamnusium bicolor]